jgi:hypothetical protein
MARIVFFIALTLYGGLFYMQQGLVREAAPSLSYALPAKIQQVALGYLKNIGAQTLFVRSAIFVGGLPPQAPPETYADALAQNYRVMTEMYPAFTDSYLHAQSFLPHLSRQSAVEAIQILKRGMAAHPENIFFPFFAGFNYYYHLDENGKAAEIFLELAQKPGAPAWLGHFAAVLSGSGGDLHGGLHALQVMLSIESDEEAKIRYENGIRAFEAALAVRDAIHAFEQRHGSVPSELEELIPDFLLSIPVPDSGFVLSWDPPDLKVLRSRD